MRYQTTLIDKERGHYSVGTGADPVRATMQAFERHVERSHTRSEAEVILKEMTTDHVNRVFRLAAITDNFMESPRGLVEGVDDIAILVRIDKSKDPMFEPVGFVRVIF